MITIHTLASGSEGNAALVCGGGVRILGISARRIETALRSLNRLPQALSAVFITHTHSDHTAGLRVLLKHTGAPVFASPAVCAALLRQIPGSASLLRPLCPGDAQVFGPLTVTAFATSHDTPGSMDYRFDCGGASADYCCFSHAFSFTGRAAFFPPIGRASSSPLISSLL